MAGRVEDFGRGEGVMGFWMNPLLPLFVKGWRI